MQYKQVTDQAQMILALREQQKTFGLDPSNTIILNKHTYRNNINFPLNQGSSGSKTVAASGNKRDSLSASFGISEPPKVHIVQSPKPVLVQKQMHESLVSSPSPAMTSAKIKELIYGAESRRIQTATTFKSSALKKKPPAYYRHPSPQIIKNDNFMALTGTSINI